MDDDYMITVSVRKGTAGVIVADAGSFGICPAISDSCGDCSGGTDVMGSCGALRSLGWDVVTFARADWRCDVL